ncbi:DNA-binding transcriptional regulator, GntR family [Actinopolyspora lacussalsi subsp. righensis]|uniref:DNA-binding transcriptional regulator, GntR family n=1 Tax=Actinopolyspora righensis TaxID=995060 RepID=A0A1I7ASL8_9ACTN|nr:GntR family transcriptional regulator [Actinopolyspora righensis]SFT77930.1 DNA-binding transcriptional regulator, GntR family [Actinopolyspora righensis]
MPRPPTTQQFVLEELRRAILSRQLAPNQPIRQDSVAHELGVSRVPLREALKTLEAEGQVVYRPHRGYTVAELSLADLLEVYRLRELLETEAALVSATKADEADSTAVRAELRAVAEAAANDDLVEMIAANRRFHFAILEPADMPWLMRMVRTLWDTTDAYRAVYYNAPDNRSRVLEEHEAIVRAFEARDGAELAELLRRHREHAVAALRTTLDETANG